MTSERPKGGALAGGKRSANEGHETYGRVAGTAGTVKVTVNLLGESAAALHVVGTRSTDQPEWLPKSQIEVAPGALAAAKASRAAGRIALLDLVLPGWLASQHGFAADVLEGQGSLW